MDADFNVMDPNHAHLILYRGAQIIGYADVAFFPHNQDRIHLIDANQDQENLDAKSHFLTLIDRWVESLKQSKIISSKREKSDHV